MGRRKGARQTKVSERGCLYCDARGCVPIRGLACCADVHACSDRMQAQGLGRRDWAPVEQEALRYSLADILRRWAGE